MAKWEANKNLLKVHYLLNLTTYSAIYNPTTDKNLAYSSKFVYITNVAAAVHADLNLI